MNIGMIMRWDRKKELSLPLFTVLGVLLVATRI